MNKIYYRGVNLLFAAILTTILTGCVSSLTTVRKLPQDAPGKTRFLYSGACECMGRRIGQYLKENNIRMVLFTDRVNDGTKNPLLPLPTELSLGGHNVLQHLTNQYIDSNYVVQPLLTPTPIASYFNRGNLLQPEYFDQVMKLHTSNALMAFDGEFTAFDQSAGSGGQASTLKYGAEDAQASAKSGTKSNGGLINFVLKVGNPKHNNIIKTIGLQAPFTRNNKTRSFTIAYKDAGIGFSHTEVKIDGLHNVQENMIAAAWFYAWAAIIPGDNELSCLGSNQTSPTMLTEWMREWDTWNTSEQISALQIELNRYTNGTSVPGENSHEASNDNLTAINTLLLPVDGKLGDTTWSRIRDIELKLGLSPHSKGNLDSLYVALLQTRENEQ